MASVRLTSPDGEVAKSDFEIGESKSKKNDRIVSLTRIQTLAAVVVFIVVIIMVAVVCFYETKRRCESKHEHATIDGGGDHFAGDEEGSPTGRGSSGDSTMDRAEPWAGRLPADVIPLSYDLHLTPYLNEEDVDGTNKERFTFDGTVVIELQCVVATDQIVLHFENGTVGEVSVVESGNEGTDMYDSLSLEGRYSFLRIRLRNDLRAGDTYLLTINYIGTIRAGLAGFYRGKYIANEKGDMVWLAATQMQPVDARFVIPCFDEPALKAIFDVRITHRTHMVALSNGREMAVIDHGDGWSTTSYETTPMMSTYLLAFVVGALNYTETITSNGIRLRVWSRPDAVQSTSFSLEAGSALLSYFEDYFNSSFHMSKLDMVALPQFGSGGMENWGLILYPEENLLYEANVNTRTDQQNILSTISHELAHQWFGNLVTMEWWDDLWLNEGFGTYFGHVGADTLYPELKLMETLVTQDFQHLLDIDSRVDSHPIRQPVYSPSEISEIFDTISYTKGAAVLRMLHNILGDEVFQRGIRLFLNRFNYGNAKTTDLWDAFTEADQAGGQSDVRLVMDTWTLQAGYPLVNLSRVDRTRVTAVQGLYLMDSDSADQVQESPFGYVWYVYLSHTHNRSRNYINPRTTWLTDGSPHTFALEDSISAGDWYLVNIEAYGVFRVNYELQNWQRLTDQLILDHKVIPVLSRAQLVEDSFSLALRGDLPVGIPFNLARYLRNEFSSAPWKAALKQFIFFRDMLGRTAAQGAYEKYLRVLTDRLYQELGFGAAKSSMPVEYENTRELILPVACKVRNEDCTNHSTTLFRQFMTSFNASDPSTNSLDVNTMDVVLCTVIREGGNAEWEYAWSIYTDPTTSILFIKNMLAAMSCSIRPWQLQRLLEYTLEAEKTRSTVFVLMEMARSPAGRTVGWDFIRHNWEALTNGFGYSSAKFLVLRSILMGVVKHFNTEQELKEFDGFVSTLTGQGEADEQQIGRITNMVDMVRSKHEAYDRKREDVVSWLQQFEETQ